MARKDDGIFELLFIVGKKMPLWLSIALAVISYLVLHRFAALPPAPAPGDVAGLGDYAGKGLISAVAMFMQYIVPAGLLIGAVVGVFARRNGGPAAGGGRHSVAGTRSSRPQASASDAPSCPWCARTMVRRTAKKGTRAGNSFWGCSNYPSCKGIVDS